MRTIKVQEKVRPRSKKTGSKETRTPSITFSGKYLEAMGFASGKIITLLIEKGKITLHLSQGHSQKGE